MIVQSLVLASLLLAAAPAAPPAGAGTPVPAPTQLKEIGRVHSTVCVNIVVHANSAISSALRNDAMLARTVSRLRNADLESSGLGMERGISDLDRMAGALNDDAVHGEGEVERLRAIARQTKDPTRKAELEAFADALGGALYRQKTVARDLGGFVAYLEAREMSAKPDDKIADAVRPDTTQAAPLTRATPATALQDGSPNDMALAAAGDFTTRMQDIARDEGAAASHVEDAVSGC
jgi:hypothetical protein